MAAIGIKMTAKEVLFADLLKDRKVGKFQMSGFAWIADYPDAQNFLQVTTGPTRISPTTHASSSPPTISCILPR
jgi:ABC-type oligopeptide transport system substrate-binding subunit